MKYSICAVEASGETVDKIRWMDRVCFREATNSLSFDGAFWWVAYDEEENACAYASLTYFPTGFGFLSRSGVLPGSRGDNLQSRLIRVRERAARGRGVSRMVTYTSVYNTHSSNNLIRCGYTLYEPPFYWGLSGANYWERNLK